MMKNKFNKILLAVVFLAGCAEFEQDPLKDYPDNVRNGVPPEEVQTKPDRSPLSVDSYRIDVEDIIEFSEDQEVSVTIGARVFVEVKSYKLSIENMETFVDAKLEEIVPEVPVPNEKKYKFTWKPPVGFTGANVMTLTPMTIKLTAERKALSTVTKDIKVLVNRNFKVPKIISAEFSNSEVLEGESTRFTVVVEDSDSTANEPPRLQFENTTNANEGGVFTTYRSVTPDSSVTRWTIVYEFNTRDNDVTDNEKRMALTFVVISRYGVRSQLTTRYIDVNNNLKEAVSSLSPGSSYTFIKGVKNAMSFTVADPTKNGDVSAVLKTATASLPGVVGLNCTKLVVGQKWLSSCEFTWTIPADAVTSIMAYPFNVEIKNLGKSGLIPVTKTSAASFSVNVITPPPAPSPTPKPTPAPEPINDGGSN